MEVNLVVLGLILDIVGVCILVIITILNPHYGKYINKPFWTKRYWWLGWRPFLKISHPSGKVERKIKWAHKAVVHGFIPPKHQWNIMGFLFVLIGFILQLKFYLS